MAAKSAHITSTEVLRNFISALRKFEAEVTCALDVLEMEGRRPAEWIEHDRARYWPAEEKKASHAVSEARVALQKAQLAGSTEEARYCYDERKLLDKAKRRLHAAEDKTQAVKRWRSHILKETEEFRGHLNRLREYLGSDFQKALAVLDRMATAVERYTELRRPDDTTTPAAPASATSTGNDSKESIPTTTSETAHESV